MTAISNGTHKPYRISKTSWPRGITYHLDSANLPSFDLMLSAPIPTATEELWQLVTAIINEEAEKRAGDNKGATAAMRERLEALGINVKVLM